MTPLPDEQPLSRRQLREQQRTTDATPDTESPQVPNSAAPGREVRENDGPEVEPARVEPALTTDQVNLLEEAEAAGKPLTRRQARDLERVRTASLTIVPPLVEPSDPAAAKKTPAPADIVEPTEVVKPAEREAADTKPAKKPRTKKNGGSNPPVPTAEPASPRMPAFVPASAAPVDVVEDEESTAPVTDNPEERSAPKRTSFGLPIAEPEDGLAALIPAEDDEDEPRLSSSFGEAVLDASAPKRDKLHTELEQPFDQIIARGLEEAGNGVGTSSLILPSMPSGDPFTGPLSAQGGVVITGSIDISSGNGSTGGHPNSFDKSDIDAMFDEEDESRPATAGTPVSASRAVSTHTATRDVITPPAPARSNRLLLILAITAGVLAVAVLSVIIVGIAAGAFQSQ
ncbi:hypothetical protein [Mycetocola zhadangensis]|uniref:Uncharacterized protein n=1 Tax=Mycetocola zhadangensis TaxID=1164595 RepID=A0A3L7JBT7_9MICO|nr:hypothetical protein [Mycetocola zhadangensis]RLQ85962.1 hypothetical protein D9V28_03705 [Mycetocola zhadangensis]GGE87255.1 hypothetical protein GCM10011313_07260 [Mycetocola zhadangensis]